MTTMGPPGTAGAEDESILSLLEHFKDDDRVGILVKELQELSTRVQTAELATIVNPRRDAAETQRKNALGSEGSAPQSPLRGSAAATHAGQVSTGGAAAEPPGGDRRASGSATGEKLRGIDAFANAVRRVRHQLPNGSITGMGSVAGGSPEASMSGTADGGTTAGGASAANNNSNSGGGVTPGARVGRVEEAVLPVPPEDTSQPLPAPAGGHEWEALQAAVNDSVAAFVAAAAKMGWKKWALTRAHSVLLVSLFWWVVAAAFKPHHPLSRPLQDFAFGHFCRHYVTVVLQLRGKARDQYQQVWIEMMAAASLYLLAEVFPRSQHKFDEGLRALITKQLRLWTAGALPADMHPSAHADAHDAAPAAYSIATQAAAATAAQSGATLAQQQAKAAAAAATAATAAAPTPSLPSFSGMAPAAYYGRGPSSRSFHSASRRHSQSQGLNGTARSRANTAVGGLGGGGGDGSDGEGGGGTGGPQAFVFTKNSPVMSRMLAGQAAGTVPVGHGSGGAGGGGGGGQALGGSGAPPVIKGLRKNMMGGTLARMHRALDEASDEELSYSRLAAGATSSASDSVAAYEASKRAAAAEAAALRRGLAEARAGIEARQRAALAGGGVAVKQLSDRLSGYIQNDLDKALAGHPASSEPVGGQHGGAEAPRYLRLTAAQRAAGGGGDGGSSVAVKPARLMAPLYEMRRVEGNIRAALAGGRHSSTDTAARVAAVTAAREAAAAADWRPLAQYPVGTKDTRRRKMAATILHGLDLDQYAT
ncbi:hypothetical protein HYH02_011577 [Chlamydomonas schloesseri]|uniref:Uncharacterized protein n=1 Tax=Chlamydomonas schloesseri TaxID=2026947 RepID=A0A835T2C1_9CHLO|nr:hypothetical protein HYH02_011577 [Chlamydomonas schloesseri]|eukprot:KAG2436066.1 hypothetical protein HYH02_011577 [Chlamydomonas schloesseri]